MPHRTFQDPQTLGGQAQTQHMMRYDLGALEQRVSGLEQGISSLRTHSDQQGSALSAQISSLSAKFDERSKIPWAALGVMLSFLTVVGGLVWWPVKENQTRIDTSIDRLANVQTAFNQRYFDTMLKADEKYLSLKEFEARFRAGSDRRDDLQKLTDQRVGRVEADVQQLEKSVVPRGEHEEKWRSYEVRHAELQKQLAAQRDEIQRQIDAIKKDFGDLYSPKDAISNMNRRIEDLERMLRRERSVNGTS